MGWFYVLPFCSISNLYLQAISEEFQFPSAQCLGNTSINFRRHKSGSGLVIISHHGLRTNYLPSPCCFLLCKMEIKFAMVTFAEL